MPIIGLPNDTPKEITDFMIGLFELYEIRARVSEHNGISFNIYTHDHNPPHVHIKYAEYEIKVSLVDFSVIKGNLPHNKEKEAIAWVKKNQIKLLNDWSRYTNLGRNCGVNEIKHEYIACIDGLQSFYDNYIDDTSNQ